MLQEAELAELVKGDRGELVGRMGLMGPIGLIGLIGLMGLMGLIGPFLKPAASRSPTTFGPSATNRPSRWRYFFISSCFTNFIWFLLIMANAIF